VEHQPGAADCLVTEGHVRVTKWMAGVHMPDNQTVHTCQSATGCSLHRPATLYESLHPSVCQQAHSH
jgi:hypothetical protein